MQPGAVVLDTVQPAVVARGGQAGNGRHDHVGEHPARLPELQERLADDVVDGIGRARIGENEAQDGGIDLVRKHDTELDQGDIEAEVEEGLVVREAARRRNGAGGPVRGP